MFRALRFGLAFGLTAFSCFAQPTAHQSPPPQASAPAEQCPAPAGPSSSPNASDPNPLEVARALFYKGDLQGAIAKYKDYLHQHPGSPDASAGLVRVYLKQKNVTQAAQLAQEALAQCPSPAIHVAHAEVLFRQGKLDEAEKEWLAVLDSGPPEPRAYLGIVRVFEATAMYKSAKKVIDKAYQLDPNDPDIQDYYVASLSLSEQIKYLEDRLAGDNNWDAAERESVKSSLELLKDRSSQNADPCRLISKVNATDLGLVPISLSAAGLSVFLNGHKSLLLLDTGASGILVSRSAAKSAHIAKITERKFGGVGDQGRKNGFVGVADSIKIGALEFQNCPVQVIESRSVTGNDGLIGADVFGQFLVDIDFPDQVLRLSPLPERPGDTQIKLSVNAKPAGSPASSNNAATNNDASKKFATDNAASSETPSSALHDRYIAPEMRSFTPVFRFGHNLLVPTTIGDVPAKLFLLDTGASTNFISSAAAQEVTKVHIDSSADVEGVNGRVKKVYTAKRAILQFGHLRQENQEMTSYDTKTTSDDLGAEVSGFLGFTMLRLLEIKIDYRDDLVDFTYRYNLGP
jgi:tetratricopeptide (TPR) repeat protein